MSAYKGCLPTAFESEDRIPITLGNTFNEDEKVKRCLVELPDDFETDIEVSNIKMDNETSSIQLTGEDGSTPPTILKGVKRKKEEINDKTTACLLIFNSKDNTFTLEQIGEVAKVDKEESTSG
eukprot:TRINITY_DN23526_c0_g1_i1.p1 TRINITY_DN23526_c0_g1~~TRINITY_DN23526_c0_g1_i1.p1  ORF type:complete len:123 (+),score=28.87 TRINITY_DN23526_c0_g1_i1:45-413(+)